ncbi:hypothetical protein [Amycolatopsis pithecellobii]|nr:hypothetical protein [Amycolatopsis pithecellobii]
MSRIDWRGAHVVARRRPVLAGAVGLMTGVIDVGDVRVRAS